MFSIAWAGIENKTKYFCGHIKHIFITHMAFGNGTACSYRCRQLMEGSVYNMHGKLVEFTLDSRL